MQTAYVRGDSWLGKGGFYVYLVCWPSRSFALCNVTFSPYLVTEIHV
jgi:hypothetical protein